MLVLGGLCAVALLAACGGGAPLEGRGRATMAPFLPGTPEGTTYAYACPGGASFEVVAYPADAHRVTLILPERTLEMRQVPTSGTERFEQGEWAFIASDTRSMVHRGSEMVYGVCTLRP